MAKINWVYYGVIGGSLLSLYLLYRNCNLKVFGLAPLECSQSDAVLNPPFKQPQDQQQSSGIVATYNPNTNNSAIGQYFNRIELKSPSTVNTLNIRFDYTSPNCLSILGWDYINVNVYVEDTTGKVSQVVGSIYDCACRSPCQASGNPINIQVPVSVPNVKAIHFEGILYQDPVKCIPVVGAIGRTLNSICPLNGQLAIWWN